MTIFTIDHDGTNHKQITHDAGTNWAPYPAPDGKHIVLVKILAEFNYEIFYMKIETSKETRFTYNDAFDGFPSISSDIKTLCFSSGRDAAPGKRTLTLYLMDISSIAE